MTGLSEIENRAGICRLTCGWKKPQLPLDWVLRYWRDVHSPAIARRAGVYDYRHYQFADVRPDVFAPIDGIEFTCPLGAQVMWTSDVRYRDEAGLAAFGVSPDNEVKAHLLGDIDLIVDKSTTYKAVGGNAITLVDATGIAAPQGSPAKPTFALFVRQRGSEDAFRECLRKLSKNWAATSGVLRLRLSLFDVPDMEAERKAGYPVKTHPVEQQYQAMIELVLNDSTVARTLTMPEGIAMHVAGMHAYPVAAVYTSNYNGRPTLVGLRGFAAHEAIMALNGVSQTQPRLLEWMYGSIAAHKPEVS
ncbi:MAG: hypothetical protein EXR10_12210 [Alphaproteobacteria bacterium]|nr:hypothetical protein [Alphaproteobacteria bacterium]